MNILMKKKYVVFYYIFFLVIFASFNIVCSSHSAFAQETNSNNELYSFTINEDEDNEQNNIDVYGHYVGENTNNLDTVLIDTISLNNILNDNNEKHSTKTKPVLSPLSKIDLWKDKSSSVADTSNSERNIAFVNGNLFSQVIEQDNLAVLDDTLKQTLSIHWKNIDSDTYNDFPSATSSTSMLKAELIYNLSGDSKNEKVVARSVSIGIPIKILTMPNGKLANMQLEVGRFSEYWDSEINGNYFILTNNKEIPSGTTFYLDIAWKYNTNEIGNSPTKYPIQCFLDFNDEEFLSNELFVTKNTLPLGLSLSSQKTFNEDDYSHLGYDFDNYNYIACSYNISQKTFSNEVSMLTALQYTLELDNNESGTIVGLYINDDEDNDPQNIFHNQKVNIGAYYRGQGALLSTAWDNSYHNDITNIKTGKYLHAIIAYPKSLERFDDTCTLTIKYYNASIEDLELIDEKNASITYVVNDPSPKYNYDGDAYGMIVNINNKSSVANYGIELLNHGHDLNLDVSAIAVANGLDAFGDSISNFGFGLDKVYLDSQALVPGEDYYYTNLLNPTINYDNQTVLQSSYQVMGIRNNGKEYLMDIDNVNFYYLSAENKNYNYLPLDNASWSKLAIEQNESFSMISSISKPNNQVKASVIKMSWDTPHQFYSLQGVITASLVIRHDSSRVQKIIANKSSANLYVSGYVEGYDKTGLKLSTVREEHNLTDNEDIINDLNSFDKSIEIPRFSPVGEVLPYRVGETQKLTNHVTPKGGMQIDNNSINVDNDNQIISITQSLNAYSHVINANEDEHRIMNEIGLWSPLRQGVFYVVLPKEAQLSKIVSSGMKIDNISQGNTSFISSEGILNTNIKLLKNNNDNIESDAYGRKIIRIITDFSGDYLIPSQSIKITYSMSFDALRRFKTELTTYGAFQSEDWLNDYGIQADNGDFFFDQSISDIFNDIDGNGITDIINTAYDQITVNVPSYLDSYIAQAKLSVASTVSDFKSSLSIKGGEKYRYNLHYLPPKDSHEQINGLVLYNIFENSTSKGIGNNNRPSGSSGDWKGVFDSIDLTEVKLLGANPKVYYYVVNNESDSAPLFSYQSVPGISDGYPNLSDTHWTDNISDIPKNRIKGIAVDVTYGGFKLQPNDYVNVYVTMSSPLIYGYHNIAYNQMWTEIEKESGVSYTAPDVTEVIINGVGVSIDKASNPPSGTFYIPTQIKMDSTIEYVLKINNTTDSVINNVIVKEMFPKLGKYDIDKIEISTDWGRTKTLASEAGFIISQDEKNYLNIQIPVLEDSMYIYIPCLAPGIGVYENRAAITSFNDQNIIDSKGNLSGIYTNTTYHNVSPCRMSIVKEQRIHDETSLFNSGMISLKDENTQIIDYRITIGKESILEPQNITITDIMPVSSANQPFEFIKGSLNITPSIHSDASYDEETRTLKISLDNMESNSSSKTLSITFSVRVPDITLSEQVWTNTATLEYSSPLHPDEVIRINSNSVTVVKSAIVPQVNIDKSVEIIEELIPKDPMIGRIVGSYSDNTVKGEISFLYKLHVINQGTGGGKDLNISDIIPDGLRLYPETLKVTVGEAELRGRTIHWEINQLLPDDEAFLSFQVTTPKVDTTTVWENIGYLEYSNNPDNKDEELVLIPSNQVDIIGKPYAPDLELIKEQTVKADATDPIWTQQKIQATSNDLLYYRLRIKNNGEIPARNIHITDSIPQYTTNNIFLPLQLIEDSITENGYIDSDGYTICWDISELAVNEEKIVSFAVSLPTYSQSIEYDNQAIFSYENISDDGDNLESNIVKCSIPGEAIVNISGMKELIGGELEAGDFSFLLEPVGKDIGRSVYVFLYDEHELQFSSYNIADPNKELTASWIIDEKTTPFSSYSRVHWYSYRSSIDSIIIADEIYPYFISYWFYGTDCSIIKGLELINTRATTDMTGAFESSKNLINLDALTNWDTSNVLNMSRLFYSSSNLIDITGLEKWQTSKVTNMTRMFGNCTSLENIDPIQNWDVSNVKNMSYMFTQCSKIESFISLDAWTPLSLTTTTSMFTNTPALTSGLLPNWYLSSSYLLSTPAIVNPNFNEIDNNIVPFATNNIGDNDGDGITDIIYWAMVRNPNNSEGYILHLSNSPISYYSIYRGNYNGKEAWSDPDDIPWKDYMLSYGESGSGLAFSVVDSIVIDNRIAPASTAFLFWYNTIITELDLSNLDTSHVTDMSYMFTNCYKLQSVDFSLLDTRNVIDMKFMFYGCQNLDQMAIGKLDVSNVRNMEAMFRNAIFSNVFDLSEWNTTNVENLSQIFSHVLLDSRFTLQYRGYIGWASYVKKEPTIILPDDFGMHATKMDNMFHSRGFEVIDASGLNTTSAEDVSNMFLSCEFVQKIVLGKDFILDNVITADSMFSKCTRLENIIITGDYTDWTFNDTIAFSSPGMFNSCRTLPGYEDKGMMGIYAKPIENGGYFTIETEKYIPPEAYRLDGSQFLNIRTGFSNDSNYLKQNMVFVFEFAPLDSTDTSGYQMAGSGYPYERIRTQLSSTEDKATYHFADIFFTKSGTYDFCIKLIAIEGIPVDEIVSPQEKHISISIYFDEKQNKYMISYINVEDTPLSAPIEMFMKYFAENPLPLPNSRISSNNENGAFNFDSMVFNKTGDYFYRVSEIIDENKTNVIYDTTTYLIVINVFENEEHRLDYTIEIINEDTKTVADTCLFTNILNEAHISINKTQSLVQSDFEVLDETTELLTIPKQNNIKYHIYIENTSKIIATDVTVVDALPANMHIIDNKIGISYTEAYLDSLLSLYQKRNQTLPSTDSKYIDSNTMNSITILYNEASTQIEDAKINDTNIEGAVEEVIKKFNASIAALPNMSRKVITDEELYSYNASDRTITWNVGDLPSGKKLECYFYAAPDDNLQSLTRFNNQAYVEYSNNPKNIISYADDTETIIKDKTLSNNVISTIVLDSSTPQVDLDKYVTRVEHTTMKTDFYTDYFENGNGNYLSSKTSEATVYPNDVVYYRVKIRQIIEDAELNSFTFTDQLPHGMKYLKDTFKFIYNDVTVPLQPTENTSNDTTVLSVIIDYNSVGKTVLPMIYGNAGYIEYACEINKDFTLDYHKSLLTNTASIEITGNDEENQPLKDSSSVELLLNDYRLSKEAVNITRNGNNIAFNDNNIKYAQINDIINYRITLEQVKEDGTSYDITVQDIIPDGMEMKNTEVKILKDGQVIKTSDVSSTLQDNKWTLDIEQLEWNHPLYIDYAYQIVENETNISGKELINVASANSPYDNESSTEKKEDQENISVIIPELHIDKTVLSINDEENINQPYQLYSNDVITYQIKAWQPIEHGTLYNVVINDKLPAHTKILSDTISTNDVIAFEEGLEKSLTIISDGEWKINIDKMEYIPADKPFIITYSVKIDSDYSMDSESDSFVNTVTTTINEKEGPKDSETLETTSDPKISVTKTAVSSIKDGTQRKYAVNEKIEYEIVVTNIGNITLYNVSTNDILTKNIWPENSDEDITLLPGQSITYTCSYLVTEEDLFNGKVINTVSTEGTTSYNKTVKDEASVTDYTIDYSPNISIEKTTTSSPKDGSKKYQLGEEITYNLLVTNNGNITLTNVIVKDDITNDVWPKENEDSIVLLPGESKEFECSYIVKETDIHKGMVHNIGSVEAATKHNDTVEDSDEQYNSVSDPQSLIDVEKVILTQPNENGKYHIGDLVEYQITVKNKGNIILYNIDVDDEMTEDHWVIDKLEPNESKTFTTTYVIQPHNALTEDVTNIVIVRGFDSLIDENKTTVEAQDIEYSKVDESDPSISLTKNITGQPQEEKYKVGETIYYELIVTNTGEIPLSDVVLNDDLPGISIIKEEKYDIDEDNNAYIGYLDAGESVTVNAEYIVQEADLGTELTNYALVSGKAVDYDSDNDGTNDTVQDDDEVLASIDDRKVSFEITKNTIDKKEFYLLSDSITYEIIVKNTGNVTLHDIVVEDELTGDNWTIDSLAPQTQSNPLITKDYIVTAEDVEEGNVLNIATATVTDEENNAITESASEDNIVIKVPDNNTDNNGGPQQIIDNPQEEPIIDNPEEEQIIDEERVNQIIDDLDNNPIDNDSLTETKGDIQEYSEPKYSANLLLAKTGEIIPFVGVGIGIIGIILIILYYRSKKKMMK